MLFQIGTCQSADTGKEIKPNAMYQFLNRAIERAELPIQKMEEGQYAQTKGGASSQEGSTPSQSPNQ